MKPGARLVGIAIVLVATTMWKCDAGDDISGKPEDTTGAAKEDRWNWVNDPSRFNVAFKYGIAELPRTGTAEQMPWSESWWPMRSDGFNDRWQGSDTLSPLEKYDQAFNGWIPTAEFMALRPFSYPGDPSTWDAAYYDGLGPAAEWESRFGGNARARNGIDDDGDGQTDESDDWDGLGSWWGKCHMWSAVAVLVPEPRRPVAINGVTFEYSDITALVMEAYFNHTRSYMLGDRCNDREIARDDHGRPTNTACRDTNAGSFHVVVTNMLGVHKRAFVMDKSGGDQVWNHPVRDFEVTLLEERPLAEALTLLRLPAGDTYPYNPDARKFYEARMTLGYVSDGVSPSRTPHGSVRRSDSYHYLLELDGNNRIIGGEWIGEGGPDFFWLPVMSTYKRGGNPHVKFADVETLLRLSTQPEEPAPAGDDVRVESTAPVSIPDNDEAGVTSTIAVGTGGAAGAVRIAVDITHTFVGDLRIDVRHGDKTARIYSGAGGSADDLREEFAVPDFAGVDVAGDWTITVADVAAADVGTLNRWAVVYVPAGAAAPAPNRRTVEGSSATRVDIPDNDPAGVSSGITISDSGIVRGIDVHVDIRHPYAGDLRVEVHHAGTTVAVHNRTGGSSDDVVRDFHLADFDGASVAGDWKLVVSDHAARDVGYLAAWSLRASVE